jgi:hypothetical protein
MKHYLGANLFADGCFLLNSLVEFSAQASTMSNQVTEFFHKALEERGMIRSGENDKKGEA